MAVGDAYVFPGFLTPVLTLLFFQSHRLLFSHASAEVRGENTPERKVASTWDRTHNHQVMSPTRSPLSHPGGSVWERVNYFQIRQIYNTVIIECNNNHSYTWNIMTHVQCVVGTPRIHRKHQLTVRFICSQDSQ